MLEDQKSFGCEADVVGTRNAFPNGTHDYFPHHDNSAFTGGDGMATLQFPMRDGEGIPSVELSGREVGAVAVNGGIPNMGSQRIPNGDTSGINAGGEGQSVSSHTGTMMDFPAKTSKRKPQADRPIDQVIGELVEYGRLWRDAVRASTGLTNQAKAICRRYLTTSQADWEDEKKRAKIVKASAVLHANVLAGKCSDAGLNAIVLGFEQAREIFVERQDLFEAQIKACVRHLPAWHAMKANGLKGIGEVWFGLVIGETGDLSNYARHDLVWKRMGLAVIEGERQRKCTDAEKAAKHGYAPQRRSTMWNVGKGLIGSYGLGPRPMDGEDVETREDLTPYQKLFIRKLRYEAEKDPSARLPDTAEGKESYTRAAAARAKRYVEKKFLRDLWVAWRRCGQVSGSHMGQFPVSASPEFAEAAE